MRRGPRSAAAAVVTLAALLLTAAAGPPSEADLEEAVALAGASLAEMEEGNWGRAEERLLRLAEILPDNLLPAVNLAICYERLGREAAARDQVERALRLDPGNAQALHLLARLLLPRAAEREEPPEEWRRVLAEMETADPADPRPHYLRALRWSRRGRPELALEALGEALRRSPDNLLLLVERLVQAAALGDPDATADALDAVEDRLDEVVAGRQAIGGGKRVTARESATSNFATAAVEGEIDRAREIVRVYCG
ncbi:MAG: tetratricopeptide repeat protein, partial [Thermoanaerobaculia bacterium]|nr:tetratricopeptide repeat protein [Thermoanaerobaculia bacterium]